MKPSPHSVYEAMLLPTVVVGAAQSEQDVVRFESAHSVLQGEHRCVRVDRSRTGCSQRVQMAKHGIEALVGFVRGVVDVRHEPVKCAWQAGRDDETLRSSFDQGLNTGGSAPGSTTEAPVAISSLNFGNGVNERLPCLTVLLCGFQSVAATATASEPLSVNSRTQSLAVHRIGHADAPSAGLTSVANATGARNAAPSRRTEAAPACEAASALIGARADWTPYPIAARASEPCTGRPVSVSTARTGVSLDARPMSPMSMRCAKAKLTAPLTDALATLAVELC